MTATVVTGSTCRTCHKKITVSVAPPYWTAEDGSLYCFAQGSPDYERYRHRPAQGCEVVDQIVPWTNTEGALHVHVGDLVVDDGRFEVVNEIWYDPAAQIRVRVGYEGRNTVGFKDPAELVAVRRYVETTEE